MARVNDAVNMDVLLGRLTLALADVVLPRVTVPGAESMVGAVPGQPDGGGRTRLLAVPAVTLAGGVSAAWAVAYAANAFGLAMVMAGLSVLATYHGIRAFDDASATAHGHVANPSMAWRGALGIDAWLVVSAIGWSPRSAWTRSGRSKQAGKRERGNGAAWRGAEA